MNRFFIYLALASATATTSQIAASQSATAAPLGEITVPMPKGMVRAAANSIDKDWTPRIVHLKGNAHVRIYTANKDPRGVMVMQADEIDLDQTTGEIFPRGNVKLTVEDYNSLR